MKIKFIFIVVALFMGAVIGAVAMPFLAQFLGQSITNEQVETVTVLRHNDSVQGELTQRSSTNFNNGSRYQAFTLRGDNDSLAFELDAPFTASMALFSANRELLADAVGERLVVTLPADRGPFSLVVSGTDAKQFGPFRLTNESVVLQNSGSLNVGDSIFGRLNNAANRYNLTIDEAGIYQITMRSSVVDAYLNLRGQSGFHLSDDDSAGDLDAQIEAWLEAGDYRLEATTFDNDNRQGQFELTISQTEQAIDDFQQGGSIELGQAIQGYLSGNTQTYEFELTETTNVTIDLMSGDFDTVLSLQGNGVNLEDDDGGAETNSRIEQSLAPGSYQLQVRSYGSSAGTFQLVVNRS